MDDVCTFKSRQTQLFAEDKLRSQDTKPPPLEVEVEYVVREVEGHLVGCIVTEIFEICKIIIMTVYIQGVQEILCFFRRF